MSGADHVAHVDGERRTRDEEPSIVPEKRFEAIAAEVRRVNDQIQANSVSTTTIIQFILVSAIGAAVVVPREPLALLVIPYAWSVWLLHSLMLDRDTLKLHAYASALEREANAMAGQTIFAWESTYAVRASRPDSVIYRLNFGLWMLLNASAWIIGLAVLESEKVAWIWRWPYIASWAIIYAGAAWTMATRRRALNDYSGKWPVGHRSPGGA